jgi:nitrate reductase alpha subunit
MRASDYPCADPDMLDQEPPGCHLGAYSWYIYSPLRQPARARPIRL